VRQVRHLMIGVCAMLTVIAPAMAADDDHTVGEFLFNYQMFGQQEGSFLYGYLYGVTEGISWTTALAHSELGVDIYCPPEHLAGTNQMYFDILNRYVERNPETRARPSSTLPFVLVKALQDYYPCY